MGSGAHGSYGGGSSGSQPYAPSYHVEKSMHEMDIKNGTYHNGHYDKNPTAQNINDMINGNYVGNKNTNIDMPYVIDLNGNIILGRRNGNGRNGAPTPHPTLVGGKDPQVQMAGIVHIQGRKKLPHMTIRVVITSQARNLWMLLMRLLANYLRLYLRERKENNDEDNRRIH